MLSCLVSKGRCGPDAETVAKSVIAFGRGVLLNSRATNAQRRVKNVSTRDGKPLRIAEPGKSSSLSFVDLACLFVSSTREPRGNSYLSNKLVVTALVGDSTSSPTGERSKLTAAGCRKVQLFGLGIRLNGVPQRLSGAILARAFDIQKRTVSKDSRHGQSFGTPSFCSARPIHHHANSITSFPISAALHLQPAGAITFSLFSWGLERKSGIRAKRSSRLGGK
jgi:hypothetical protein